VHSYRLLACSLLQTVKNVSAESSVPSVSPAISSVMPTDGISPGAVLVCVGGGTGVGEPTEGISPAVTREDKAQIRDRLISERFMGSPLN
jgi:hypothetical protein